MANEAHQPDTQPADADALIDSFLGVSEHEETPRKPRKIAASGDPEDVPPEGPDEEGEEPPPGEEGDDTDREDDADQGEGDQSPETEEGRFVGHNGRVKLADGTVTTVAELMKGNLRQADYTRKTQETGALHQELQNRIANYAQQEQIVSLAIDLMAQAMPPQPDARLLQPGEHNDPIGYTNQKLLWENAAQQLQTMMAAKQQMAEQHAAIQGTMLKRYAIEQKDKLLGYMPELAKKDKLDAFNTETLKTLARYGKGANDLAQVYDADIIHMLRDLNNYHKIMDARKAAKAKTDASGAQVMTPGTRASPAGTKARAQAKDWETLRKTGGRRGTAGEAALDRILDPFVQPRAGR